MPAHSVFRSLPTANCQPPTTMFYLMIVAVPAIWYFPGLVTALPRQMKMGG